MSVLTEIRKRFQPVLAELTPDVTAALGMIKPSQDAKFGDFQANCAMSLAKTLGKSPREVAQAIVDKVQVSDFCEPLEIAGPGFINLRIKPDWVENAATQLSRDERIGHQKLTPRNYVIDYSSPNVAKPMHVGHLRSSVIGCALDRMLRFVGHSVISDNHIGDWGTQFGMIIFGYKNFVNAAAYQADAVTELARLYRLVNQLCDYRDSLIELPKSEAKLVQLNGRAEQIDAAGGDPKQVKQQQKKLQQELTELREEISGLKKKIEAVTSSPVLLQLADAYPEIVADSRQETAKLHAGDPENQKLWDEFIPKCLAALDGVYRKLGIVFDKTLGESFYNPFLADVVKSLQSQGLARDSEGATCVFIEGYEAPFMVQKKNGAFTYATTDLATVRYRVEEFGTEAMLYVVDKRQAEHFQLLFETSRRWGYRNVAFHHVSFGTVLGNDGKPFKTRAGDTVGLESLLDEAVARAYKIVSENNPELDEATRQSVAEAVGIGGIKYADLHHNRESDYKFDWDKMLATNGDTATYIQYANARMNGILRKGQIDRSSLEAQSISIRITNAAERALVMHLLSFEDALNAAVEEMRPSILTQFLFETANRATAFHQESPVLKEPDEQIRLSRLMLCVTISRTLTLGLSLLGIAAPDKM